MELEWCEQHLTSIVCMTVGLSQSQKTAPGPTGNSGPVRWSSSTPPSLLPCPSALQSVSARCAHVALVWCSGCVWKSDGADCRWARRSAAPDADRLISDRRCIGAASACAHSSQQRAENAFAHAEQQCSVQTPRTTSHVDGRVACWTVAVMSPPRRRHRGRMLTRSCSSSLSLSLFTRTPARREHATQSPASVTQSATWRRQRTRSSRSSRRLCSSCRERMDTPGPCCT